MRKNAVLILSIPILLIVGIVIYKFSASDSVCETQKYAYLNPEVERFKDGLALQNFGITLSDRVNALVEAAKQKDPLLEVGYFFRDLQFNKVVAKDAYQTFLPASLLKLPLMIDLFKKSQNDPTLLQRKITYKDSLDGVNTTATQNVVPSSRLIDGQEFTIEQLIEIMITQSSNQAAGLLLNAVGGTEGIQQVLSAMNILMVSEGNQRFLTPQSYSSIFDRLYNSTFLRPELSNFAIEILSRSEYKTALPRYLPKDLKVAHKFGERKIENNIQLHDCGLIYFVGFPYTLCIMTRGKDFKELEDLIADLSLETYKRVSEVSMELVSCPHHL